MHNSSTFCTVLPCGVPYLMVLTDHNQVDGYLPRLAGLIRDPHELVRRQVRHTGVLACFDMLLPAPLRVSASTMAAHKLECKIIRTELPHL